MDRQTLCQKARNRSSTKTQHRHAFAAIPTTGLKDKTSTTIKTAQKFIVVTVETDSSDRSNTPEL